MNSRELVVIGAGPAGLTASIEAAKRGVEVLLVDENQKAGGQLFKQIHKFFGSKSHMSGVRGIDIGKKLIEETHALGVEVWLDSTVTGLFENNKIAVERKLDSGNKLEIINAEKIVIAAGASEKVINFKGWTLPGVMGAGAIQTLINVHRVLPGEKVLMIGSGNVGLIVSYQLIQAGAEVVGVIDAVSSVGGYEVHAAKIKRAGVPIFTEHTILEAEGNEEVGVTGATVAKVDQNWDIISGTEKYFDVDVVSIAAGLEPLGELANMSECERIYLAELGGWVPIHNKNMESTTSGVYVAGDVAGVEEANTALEEGRLAGIDIAEKVGKIGQEESRKEKEKIRKRLKGLRLGPFGEERLKAKNILREKYKEFKSSNNNSNGKNSDENEGPIAVIECDQEIPCDPCETACKFGAIEVGQPITNLPVLDKTKCTGCGLCLPECPGLAIFLIDKSYSETHSTISFPFEYQPLPEEGDKVKALDRKGNFVCFAEVVKLKQIEKFDKTPILTIAVPDEHIDDARNAEIINEGGETDE